MNSNLEIILSVSKLIFSLLGIPLNLSIVVTVTCNRQLRNTPSNIFLLGIMFSYLSFFVPVVIELIYWQLRTIESICQLHVAIVGIPHVFLLLNMSLALTDRYVAINYPDWYREKMTVSLACAVVILSSVFLCSFMQLVYILGLATLDCEIWNVHAKILSSILVVLFVICSALNLNVCRKIPNGLLQTSQTTCRLTNESGQSMPIQVDGRDVMDERETKATRVLIIGITCLIVTACISVVVISSFVACDFFIGEFECGNLTWIEGYINQLTVILAFYCSLVFLVGSEGQQ